jgi:hypothetical protein
MLEVHKWDRYMQKLVVPELTLNRTVEPLLLSRYLTTANKSLSLNTQVGIS